ncbi:hypothetical protein C8Q80DRAFT_1124123 [Daedaleopsis nitida]|nr:hypothetical protein C8Q80DRAFT_1124123 [Daedaleopsis nitida]
MVLTLSLIALTTVTSNPRELAFEPRDVAFKPRGVVLRPHEVAFETCPFAAHPHCSCIGSRQAHDARRVGEEQERVVMCRARLQACKARVPGPRKPGPARPLHTLKPGLEPGLARAQPEPPMRAGLNLRPGPARHITRSGWIYGVRVLHGMRRPDAHWHVSPQLRFEWSLITPAHTHRLHNLHTPRHVIQVPEPPATMDNIASDINCVYPTYIEPSAAGRLLAAYEPSAEPELRNPVAPAGNPNYHYTMPLAECRKSCHNLHVSARL